MLNRGNGAEPNSLDLHLVSGIPEANILLDLYEGLMCYGPDGKPVPGVAENWAVSPDGKTYTFKLRADAKWSDGSSVTSADFDFAWKRILDPKTAAEYAYFLAPIVITSAGEWFATSAGYRDSVIKAVRKVFDAARQKAPAILFIEEIDAILNRETLASRNGDWWLPVVNDILLLLDNATSERRGVIAIGATNRPNAIDPAILRPGRLSGTCR